MFLRYSGIRNDETRYLERGRVSKKPNCFCGSLQLWRELFFLPTFFTKEITMQKIIIVLSSAEELEKKVQGRVETLQHEGFKIVTASTSMASSQYNVGLCYATTVVMEKTT
jgi:hypothetical protein